MPHAPRAHPVVVTGEGGPGVGAAQHRHWLDPQDPFDEQDQRQRPLRLREVVGRCPPERPVDQLGVLVREDGGHVALLRDMRVGDGGLTEEQRNIGSVECDRAVRDEGLADRRGAQRQVVADDTEAVELREEADTSAAQERVNECHAAPVRPWDAPVQ